MIDPIAAANAQVGGMRRTHRARAIVAMSDAVQIPKMRVKMTIARLAGAGGEKKRGKGVKRQRGRGADRRQEVEGGGQEAEGEIWNLRFQI